MGNADRERLRTPPLSEDERDEIRALIEEIVAACPRRVAASPC